MLLAFGAIAYGISKTRIFHINIVTEEKWAAVVFMTGVILLGELAYYLTRAAYYGLLITFPFALILITYFADFFGRNCETINLSCCLRLYCWV